MDILMKYAKKKTVFILSTVLSGIVTLLYLISKFGPTTSSNVNINGYNYSNYILSIYYIGHCNRHS